MKNERMQSEQNISPEYTKEDINSMLLQALSPVWAKSVQELIPGYLPDKATNEYSKEELSLFRFAYKLLGEMVKDGKVEVIFEDTSAPTQNSVMDTESTAKPKFKLVNSGGTKARDEQQFLGTNISWEGALRKDNITP